MKPTKISMTEFFDMCDDKIDILNKAAHQLENEAIDFVDSIDTTTPLFKEMIGGKGND